MYKLIAALKSHIKNDFVKAIERWSDVIAYHLCIKMGDAFDYAIERIAKLDDDDFFEELSPPIHKALQGYMEACPMELRAAVEAIFKEIADKTYGYRFPPCGLLLQAGKAPDDTTAEG